MSLVVIAMYVIVTTWLSLYGFHAIALCWLYLIHRKDRLDPEPLPVDELPDVTVQLPVYNERYVVERLIDAVASFDWPRHKLHVQVLDDSTDETTGLARARAELHRAHGIDITVIHRTARTGFKAGAMQAGLAYSNSPFVAIFDGDFNPAPDFLQRTIPAFVGRPDVGWVQTRWTHLNESYSGLTRAFALLFDGHFAVEQVARSRVGLPMMFNGSAGVWRRECIEAADGWQSDTLIEDADLSYRAQMIGWRGLMLPDVTVPAELPVQMGALKQQNFRWAKGGAQTLRKLAVPLLKSRLPFWKKAAGLFQLSSFLAHPLIILALVMWLPFVLHPDWFARLPVLTFLGVAMVGMPLEFLLGQIALYRGDVRRMLYCPLLLIVGTGLAFNNARAVIEGLVGWRSEFVRTPKFRMEGASETWKRSVYVLSADPTAFGEAMMAGYAAFMAIEAWRGGNLGSIPFLLMYAGGFVYVAIGSAMNARPPRRRSALHAKADVS